jgi:hypothetical protein
MTCDKHSTELASQDCPVNGVACGGFGLDGGDQQMTRREILTLCLIYPTVFAIITQVSLIGLLYGLGDSVRNWTSVSITRLAS